MIFANKLLRRLADAGIAGRSLDLSYGAFIRVASANQGVAKVCFAMV